MKHSVPEGHQDTAATLDSINRNAAQMGYDIVEIAGFLDGLGAQCRAQKAALDDMAVSGTRMTESSQRMIGAADGMSESARTMADTVKGSLDLISANTRTSVMIADWVRSVHSEGDDVEQMLAAVRRSNEQVASIASQVNMLAMNAKIEAARAGAAGQGFAIVAEAINELAQKTGNAAENISATVSELAGWMNAMQQGAEKAAVGASELLNRSTETDQALSGIQSQAASTQSAAQSLQADLTANCEEITRFGPAIAQIDEAVGVIVHSVDEATTRAETLIDTSEAIYQAGIHLGATSEDDVMILRAQDLAGRIGACFEECLNNRVITAEALFDDTYVPLYGTDPQQVTTGFTNLTDQILPQLQEPVLAEDDRIVFCAAVDRNGYLPTHNQKFSRPQTADPVWNAANSRNRRIFDDRVGLKAGRSTAPFLLQIYRRDMGGGTYAMMKDLSAPITVAGRHWGGLRIAYRFG